MSLRPGTNLNIPQTTMEPFKDIEQIHLQWNKDITDDETVPKGKQYTSTRIQIMITTLATEKSAEALLKATRELMAALRNKLPTIRFAKWNDTDATRNAKNTVKQIPVEVDKAEEYIQNFSRYSKATKGYFRLQVIHDEDTPKEAILETGRSFNVTKQQSLYAASSQALVPVMIGLLTGSTEAMVDSPDLLELIKKKSKIKEIGFAWRYMQSGKKGKYDNDQKAIYIETESSKAHTLRSFLNSALNDLQQQIFGVQFTFVPSGTYPTNQQKTKIQKYAPVQASLVTALRETEVEISAFQQLEITNNKGEKSSVSVVEALLQVESIVEKQGIKKDKILSFKGNVFYAAITNAETKFTIFQYLSVNEAEATSILRALPLFLKDHFKLEEAKADSFCRSSLKASARNGQWNPDTRIFLSQQDIKEQVYFDNLKLLTQAKQAQEFIDPNHKRAMMGGGMDDDTAETNLHILANETERTTPNNNADETSTLTGDTGSTATSKAKRFADEARREIIAQLQQQKANHTDEIKKHKKENEEQASAILQQTIKIQKLEEMMNRLLNTQSNQPNQTIDQPSEPEEQTQKEIEISDSEVNESEGMDSDNAAEGAN